MIRSRRLSLILAGLLVLGVTPGAWAGAPTDQLRAHIDQVLKILEDPVLKVDGRVKERRRTVRKVANDIFDFAETAKRSLARHWQGRTEKEREEFAELFADLIERSYISKIELYGGEKIQYAGERIDGDVATVSTKIVTKQGQEVPVDYRMLRRGDRWHVYDVSIEGVSLISNYRTQFNKIIQTSSYAELVKKMKTKQEEFLFEEETKTKGRAKKSP
ncbi:MAG: ABC transporter substrate-binding protein [Candidatus Rokubacteria bacterium]|nr:ABC transporter substrate-binding protein [Candidatus Rokubacteria bacterium]MBI2554182.1 ABC transporter substrate-binding protein [Candidatus Rokubacteria bacterium]